MRIAVAVEQAGQRRLEPTDSMPYLVEMTTRQDLGSFGEVFVTRHIGCLKCKRPPGILKRLPTNFKCADLICEFCGWLAQVKAHASTDISSLPKVLLGAAWEPQRRRMESGIYFPMFIVAATGLPKRQAAVYYLGADLQSPDLFHARKPLSSTARRAGWQGYLIKLDSIADRLVRLV